MGMVLCLRGASLEQLANLRANADAADDFLFDDAAYEAGELVDFDKAWNALQFMFTGCDAESDHPLSFFRTKRNGLELTMDMEALGFSPRYKLRHFTPLFVNFPTRNLRPDMIL